MNSDIEELHPENSTVMKGTECGILVTRKEYNKLVRAIKALKGAERNK